MKEIEIIQPLDLNEAQQIALEMHSFLNIMSVLTMELAHLGALADNEQALERAIELTIELGSDLRKPDYAYGRLDSLDEDMASISHHLITFFDDYPAMREQPEAISAHDNIESIFHILRQRTHEMLARIEHPGAWEQFEIKDLSERFLHVLNAIEKNAKGEYRIITNMAAQEPKDYYVDFKIESVDAPHIHLPPVFQDVFRDLIANARKYTPPGGRISAHMHDNGSRIVMVVEDTGCGIPEGEMERVVNFGTRASNVLRRRTMGDGCGLTKAYQACSSFGGRMWLRSKLGHGTRVKIIIPSQRISQRQGAA